MAAAQAAAQAAAPAVTFTDGFITIREIEFEAENEAIGRRISIEHEQIVRIDFATGETTPTLEPVLIPAGTYSYVSISVELLDESDEPGMVLLGTYTRTDGSTVPLRFEFNSGEVFEAEGEDVTFGEEMSAMALITFDPGVWFSVISANRLDNAELVNGVLVVSETVNEDIFNDVADRLDEATEVTIQVP